MKVPSTSLYLKIWCVFAVVVFIFSECSVPFFSSKADPIVSSQQLVKRIHRNVKTLESFTGKAKIRMLSDQYVFKGTITITMKRPDSLHMKFEGPMGIDVASVRSGGRKMQYLIPSEKVLYKGTVDRLRELGLVPWNVEVSNIIQSFLGLIDPPDNLEDSLIAYSSQEDAYILPIGSDSLQEKIWIDPKGPVVSRWERQNKDGTPLWLWEGEMFYKRGRLRLPKFIQITQFNPRQRIIFYYEIMDVNHRLAKDWYSMKIPEGVEEIEL